MANSILIIDDNEFFAATLKKKFNIVCDDVEVFIAANGKEGIKKAKKMKPGLILLDIMMPDIYGDKVFQELNESGETSDIKVVFLSDLTGHGFEEKMSHDEI
ncbi:MAG: CheY-like chemotaxis protein, partial [Pseudohongiellaceae bacterium]